MPTRTPKFLGPSTLNLTAVVGATVVLPCRVTRNFFRFGFYVGLFYIIYWSGDSPWCCLPLLGPPLRPQPCSLPPHSSLLWLHSLLIISSPRPSPPRGVPGLDPADHRGRSQGRWDVRVPGEIWAQKAKIFRCFQVNTEPKMSRVVNLAVVEGTGTLGPGPALALKVACCNMFLISYLTWHSRASNWVRIDDTSKPQFWLQECLHPNQETQSPWSAWSQNTKHRRPISPGKLPATITTQPLLSQVHSRQAVGLFLSPRRFETGGGVQGTELCLPFDGHHHHIIHSSPSILTFPTFAIKSYIPHKCMI